MEGGLPASGPSRGDRDGRGSCRAGAFPVQDQAVECVVKRSTLDCLVGVEVQFGGHGGHATSHPLGLELFVGGCHYEPFERVA